MVRRVGRTGYVVEDESTILVPKWWRERCAIANLSPETSYCGVFHAEVRVLTVSTQRDAIILSRMRARHFPQLRLVSMSALTRNRLDKASLPLWNAIFCLDCELISNSQGDECPICNGRSLVSLARILGGSLFAHREQAPQEHENQLSDVTITIDLQHVAAKDLTTTLERVTGVLAPKLATDQATFHINVTPSSGRIKLQDSFRFPEREAA